MLSPPNGQCQIKVPDAKAIRRNERHWHQCRVMLRSHDTAGMCGVHRSKMRVDDAIFPLWDGAVVLDRATQRYVALIGKEFVEGSWDELRERLKRT